MDSVGSRQGVAITQSQVPIQPPLYPRALRVWGWLLIMWVASGCGGMQEPNSPTVTEVATETVTEVATESVTETVTEVATETVTVTQTPPHPAFGTSEEQYQRLEPEWLSMNQEQRENMCEGWRTESSTMIEEYDEGLRVTSDNFIFWMDAKCR
ncbi:MAG: hypothetical protein WBG36_06750 [Ornithinimicrobium sp.]